MRSRRSSRAVAALPAHYAIHRAFYPAKRALKRASNARMRARERTALDALRRGADADAVAWAVRAREVVDVWGYD